MLVIVSAGAITKAQGFISFGAGAANLKASVISLGVGYQLNHVVTEFELKAPPIDTRVANPAALSFKTGYEITLTGRWAFIPQVEASYMQYSADESKGANWKNGWKPGVGGRIRWGNLFIQGDYNGTNNYVCVGICAQFKRQQSW